MNNFFIRNRAKVPIENLLEQIQCCLKQTLLLHKFFGDKPDLTVIKSLQYNDAGDIFLVIDKNHYFPVGSSAGGLALVTEQERLDMVDVPEGTVVAQWDGSEPGVYFYKDPIWLRLSFVGEGSYLVKGNPKASLVLDWSKVAGSQGSLDFATEGVGTLEVGSTRFGVGTATYQGIEFAIGSFNKPITTRPAAFYIGNGTNYANTSNAVVIYGDGGADFSHVINYTTDLTTSFTNESLVTKRYVDSRGLTQVLNTSNTSTTNQEIILRGGANGRGIELSPNNGLVLRPSTTLAYALYSSNLLRWDNVTLSSQGYYGSGGTGSSATFNYGWIGGTAFDSTHAIRYNNTSVWIGATGSTLIDANYRLRVTGGNFRVDSLSNTTSRLLSADTVGGVVLADNNRTILHLTRTQRVSLVPTVGQIVYQTDAASGLYQYKNGTWYFIDKLFENKEILVTTNAVIDDIGFKILCKNTTEINYNINAGTFKKGHEVFLLQMGLSRVTVTCDPTLNLCYPITFSTQTYEQYSGVKIVFITDTDIWIEGLTL